MSRTESVLDQLLRSRPDERERFLPYVQRAKALHGECGCSLGGAFALTALLALVVDRLRFGVVLQGGLIRSLLLGAALVFAAGLTGKLIGVGVARLRLALLYRHLRAQYEP